MNTVGFIITPHQTYQGMYNRDCFTNSVKDNSLQLYSFYSRNKLESIFPNTVSVTMTTLMLNVGKRVLKEKSKKINILLEYKNHQQNVGKLNPNIYEKYYMQ